MRTVLKMFLIALVLPGCSSSPQPVSEISNSTHEWAQLFAKNTGKSLLRNLSSEVIPQVGASEESNTIETEFDGSWTFNRIECPSGSSVDMEVENELKGGAFIQYLMDSKTGQMTFITQTPKDKCSFEMVIQYQIRDEFIYPQRLIGSVKKCEGKPDDHSIALNSTPRPIRIRQLPSGVHELLFEEAKRVCTKSNLGTFVFRRMMV